MMVRGSSKCLVGGRTRKKGCDHVLSEGGIE